MNDTKAAGKFDQVKGKIKQSVGEAVGNERLANSGAADQVKGSAKEAWGAAKDEVRAVKNDAVVGSRTTRDTLAADAHTTGEAGHDVREKIVSAAKSVKDAVTGEAEGVRGRRRSA
ncbi:MAG: CsbD family protein [Acidobacteriota bacterium]|nr:CsbD family protein [Acidobacteriota bacterium]